MEDEELAPGQGFEGTAGVLKPGGSFEQTEQEMWKGVQTAEDTAKAASAAPGKILEAAEKQVGVLKEGHRNALMLARQEMARRATGALRRGRSTGANIQAAGSLGKQAAQEYSGMASKQAQEIAGVTQAAEREAAGLEVIAAKAWEEANTAAQLYWAGQNDMDINQEAALRNDLVANLTSIQNASSGQEDTIKGFNSAWNTGAVYMQGLDPGITQHIVAAEQLIMEVMAAAPPDLQLPIPFIKTMLPELFKAYGLEGAMEELAQLVHYMASGPMAIGPDGKETPVGMGEPMVRYMFTYMLNRGIGVADLATHQWVYDPETDQVNLTSGA